VKKWTFKPAMSKGKPVAIRSRVELEFHIEK
jgi:outer membrane biosynthesis protein TonB